MHFWIDKRSQTCGYSGRHRIPPSLQHASCGQQRRRRRRSRSKPMVTPVHRFQPIESTGLGVHGAARRAQQQQPLHSQHQYQQRQLHNYVPPTYVTHLGHPQQQQQQQRHNSAHSSELDSSVFLDIPVTSNGELASHNPPPTLRPVGTLRCGIWMSFALTSICAAGAKLYFTFQKGNGLEAMGFFALLTMIVLLIACVISLRRSTLRWDTIAATVPASQAHASTTSISHELDVTVEDETTSRAPHSPPPPPQPHLLHPPAANLPSQPELPPPPYHIAILLPPQQPSDLADDESPPPSYDKAVG